MRIGLLQYLCDIPAFGKLLHVSSQAALRGCPYCTEEGTYSKTLHKVIHINNRSFLPPTSELRKDAKNFAKKGIDESNKPKSYSKEEELHLRERYDQLPNKNQKLAHQKETGLKGQYSFMRLPYHYRRDQMQPDGMHTIADIIGNVLSMISGKDDGKKVRDCEEEMGRFPDTWTVKPKEPEVCLRKRKTSSEDENQRPAKSQRLETTPTDIPLPPAPWKLDKNGLITADQRAESLTYPDGYDYHPDKHFSKQWTLRTMHGKHQV